MKQSTKQKQVMVAPSPPVQKEVRAEQFVLVDKQGRQRAVLKTTPQGDLSDTVLTFYDGAGQLRLSLREGWQESAVTIFDQAHGETEEAVRLGYRPEAKGKSSPGLNIFDSIGSTRICLEVDPEGAGQLTVLGRDGTQTAISSDGLTVWGKADEIVAEIGVPHQVDSQSQPATAAQLVAAPVDAATLVVPEIKDPYRVMEAAIDELRFLIEDGQPICVVMNELMLLLHRIAEQPSITRKDCLEAAVSRCYHWTLEVQTAQQAHLTTLLEARANEKGGT